MIKRLFWILCGAALALQVDRWLRRRREQLTPNALLGTLLDLVNRRLEAKHEAAAHGHNTV